MGSNESKHTFVTRKKEHELFSLNKHKTSNFYTKYPNKDAKGIFHQLRNAYFHDLIMYVGFAFDRWNDCVVKQLVDSTMDGIYIWGNGYMEKIKNVNFKGCMMTTEKQLHFIAYLWELGFDLMISPENNVSESPGFEVPFGVFGR